LIVGLWFGLRLYGRLNDAAFRRVILFLLLAAGVSLIVPTALRWVRAGSPAASAVTSKIVDRGPVAMGPRTA
jgi:hypothetical protein